MIVILIIISPNWSILSTERQQEIMLAQQPEASDLEDGNIWEKLHFRKVAVAVSFFICLHCFVCVFMCFLQVVVGKK